MKYFIGQIKNETGPNINQYLPQYIKYNDGIEEIPVDFRWCYQEKSVVQNGIKQFNGYWLDYIVTPNAGQIVPRCYIPIKNSTSFKLSPLCEAGD